MATTIHTPHEQVKANIAQYLKIIAPDINQAARTRIAAECSTSLPTVNRYFAGKIGNITLGEKIAHLACLLIK